MARHKLIDTGQVCIKAAGFAVARVQEDFGRRDQEYLQYRVRVSGVIQEGALRSGTGGAGSGGART